MSYFIYTDLMCSLIDLRLVDAGSTVIYVGAYVPNGVNPRYNQHLNQYLQWLGEYLQLNLGVNCGLA